MRLTSFSPPSRSWLARAAITEVASPPAGPPEGGLYLMPPSRGGLCEGVTTMPSAVPPRRSRLCVRIACETAGVGVYPPASSISTVTPLAASTSSAVAVAGSDSAWVSAPRNSGPSVPCPVRYSQIACVVAAMWSSLNAASNDEPRCPDVPNATRCAASPGSGRRV